MKRISLFLLLFLLLKATAVYSQGGDPEANLRIVPISPNAASLGTYGLIPTDNYVGQANLTIPIYEIDLDGKKFPIALSYHTDGTRVAQEATWAGLGWTLQAGGCVIRQVQDMDDFTAKGCYNLTDAPWLTNPRFEVTDQNMERYMGYFRGDYDAEPDMFYFNAGGHSGSMFFNVLKNNRQTNAVPTIQTQEEVVKMVYNTSSNVWTMTDLEGYVYSFSKKETTYYFLNTIEFFQPDITRSHIFPYNKEPQVVTAWMLDSVTSPNGGTILFDYKKETIFTPISTTEDVISLSEVVAGEITSQSPQYFKNKFNYNYTYSKIEQWTLSKISFEGGTVEFNTTDREDIESAESGKKVQKLSSIKVSDAAGNVIKTTMLEYKYLLSGAATTTNGYDDRLLLSKVYDVAGSKKSNVYTMDYNMGKLPPKRSLSVDAWGFYNGASPMTTSLKISPSIYWSESIRPSGKTSLFKEGMDRSFNEALCKIGTLRTVTYPTGGTTTFEYEGHRFETLPMMPPLREGAINLVDNSMAPVVPGASVLMYIGEPFEVDDANPKIIIRIRHDEPHPSEHLASPLTYTTQLQKKEGNSYRTLFSSPNYDVMNPWADDIEKQLDRGTYRMTLEVQNVRLEYPINISVEVVGKTNAPLDKDYLGAGLRIKSITNTDGNGNRSWRKFEYQDAKLMVKPVFNAPTYVEQMQSWAGNWMNAYYELIQSTPYIPLTNLSRGNLVGYTVVSESYGDLATQGCITYRYHNVPDEVADLYLAGIPTIPDYKNGKLSSVDYRDKNYKLLKKEEYTYSPSSSEEVWAPKIRNYYFNPDYSHPTRDMQPYKLWAQSFYLSNKVTTDYRAEGNIVDEERYDYTNYGVLSSLKSNKHGVEKENQFRYAHSFTDAVSKKMLDKYMMGIPIERIELSGGKVVGASKTEYKDTLNMILPKRTLRFNSTTPKTLADYAGAYVQDIWFGKYTSRGRLLGYIRNNLPVSFLWAYNNLYPVAKIEGKTYEAVEKISSASISQLPRNWNNASITTVLNTVRNGLANDNALVTTYLYRPLVGVTEIVEPNKEKSTFTYDDFNRLFQVKDHNGKVVNEYQYNYKPQ